MISGKPEVFLPKEIQNIILRYNSHPVADLIKKETERKKNKAYWEIHDYRKFIYDMEQWSNGNNGQESQLCSRCDYFHYPKDVCN